MNKLFESLHKESLHTYTENGADALSSSGNTFVDLFGQAGAARSRPHDIYNLYKLAWMENPLWALRYAFYLRDAREGVGERDMARVLLHSVALWRPESMRKNLHHVPFFGRWDDLYAFVDTPLEKDALSILGTQLEMDVAHAIWGKPISLAAKWAKSPNTSSRESRVLGVLTAKVMGMKVSNYRKMLSYLRKHLGVVETHMSNGDWDKIDFSKVPSQAMTRLKDAFKRHQSDRWDAYVEALQAGSEKVNASVSMPYEILEKGDFNCRNYVNGSHNLGLNRWDNLLENQFRSMPNVVEDGDVLVVADTSGSMFTSHTCSVRNRPAATAVGLGLYLALNNKGAFKNSFITFSDVPQFVTVNPSHSIDQTVSKIKSIVANTDIEAVFELILNVAMRNGVSQEEMPTAICVISDMEFDDYSCNPLASQGNGAWNTMWEKFRDMYSDAGYILPHIVFWNVDARNSTFHAFSEFNGVSMVSGSSPQIFRQVMTGAGKNSLELVEEVLTSERYSVIEL